jgi:hypothetical protein
MYSSEARAFSVDGCATHGLTDCLCDVQPIAGGVPIRSVPSAERLLELGVSRLGLTLWAEELNALQDAAGLYLVGEA